ncbi:response regulator [Luteimonas kalidii]|uniref:Response regulator n=1 Tax=Luteimonas kalidii TaxID=3042025 RepID=A0ABT6JWG2_9GAMM|nr:response regulator [Luteimonas kalidii]MDH5834823.1 response regulator [Luteimonas kalidii]
MRNQAVLLVDDEFAIVELVGDELSDMGFEVVTARTGAEALGHMATDKVFDFIVSDVSMPEGVSGVDVARKARELQPRARVILSSGRTRAQLPDIPDDAEFLAKPYRLAQLLQLLEPV